MRSAWPARTSCTFRSAATTVARSATTTDWAAALDDSGYAGPLNLESFTAFNDTIATAASIWRPLAESQDALAERTFAYLSALQGDRGAG